ACSIMGKKVVGRNYGRSYYANQWLLILAPTASNKSALITVSQLLDDVIYIHCDTSPVSLISSRFTRAYSYSELGGVVPMKEWAKLSEPEKMQKKQEIKDNCKKLKGKLSISDEFTHTFGDLLQSGGQSGDRDYGFILQLADSGSKIEIPTATDGYRAIFDTCFSIIGYSQPETWHNSYGASVNLDSGLIGRFFIANAKDYRLRIGKLDIDSLTCEQRIRDCFQRMIERVEAISGSIECDFIMKGSDIPRLAFDELMALEKFKVFQDRGLVPFMDNGNPGKIAGKLMVQAIKYCMMDRFFAQDKVVDGSTLADGDTFKRYLGLSMDTAIKLFVADEFKSENELIEDKIFKLVISGKAKTARDIQRANLKRGNYPLKSWKGMAEQGRLAIVESKRKDSLTLKPGLRVSVERVSKTAQSSSQG
ncbi:MAG: hypothetical protein NTW19_07985, partial [Planctomycetota bacterium]|nr:hypothetical protein [Planctomycetota bacterium]